MLRIFSETDRVIIDLCGRRRDVLLSCLQADDVADSLDERAADAEKAEPTLYRGERWGVKVESYDRQVALRFEPPFEVTTDRVTLPPDAARRLASLIRSKASWAQYGMRLTLKRA
jgi:hypothetical protein